jgi:hypothetical protein
MANKILNKLDLTREYLVAMVEDLKVPGKKALYMDEEYFNQLTAKRNEIFSKVQILTAMAEKFPGLPRKIRALIKQKKIFPILDTEDTNKLPDGRYLVINKLLFSFSGPLANLGYLGTWLAKEKGEWKNG